MTEYALAEGEWRTARDELANGLRDLLASASSWALPFAGDYLQFHAYFGDQLVIDIDPRQVIHQFPPNRRIYGQKVAASNFVLGRGSWLPLFEALDNSVIHGEVAELLALDGDYRKTAGHAALVERLGTDKPPIRNLQTLDSIEQIGCYFEDVNRLIASIRDNGFRRRPHYDGLESVAEAAKASSPARPVLVELMESEIGVAVDADGSLVRVGPGNHRMAIARQLGCARVPVELDRKSVV